MIKTKYVFSCNECGASDTELLDTNYLSPLNWIKITPFKVEKRVHKKIGENATVNSENRELNFEVHFCSDECAKIYICRMFDIGRA